MVSLPFSSLSRSLSPSLPFFPSLSLTLSLSLSLSFFLFQSPSLFIHSFSFLRPAVIHAGEWERDGREREWVRQHNGLACAYLSPETTYGFHINSQVFKVSWLGLMREKEDDWEDVHTPAKNRTCWQTIYLRWRRERQFENRIYFNIQI